MNESNLYLNVGFDNTMATEIFQQNRPYKGRYGDEMSLDVYEPWTVKTEDTENIWKKTSEVETPTYEEDTLEDLNTNHPADECEEGATAKIGEPVADLKDQYVTELPAGASSLDDNGNPYASKEAAASVIIPDNIGKYVEMSVEGVQDPVYFEIIDTTEYEYYIVDTVPVVKVLERSTMTLGFTTYRWDPYTGEEEGTQEEELPEASEELAGDVVVVDDEKYICTNAVNRAIVSTDTILATITLSTDLLQYISSNPCVTIDGKIYSAGVCARPITLYMNQDHRIVISWRPNMLETFHVIAKR